jgi:hypothetical protein
MHCALLSTLLIVLCRTDGIINVRYGGVRHPHGFVLSIYVYSTLKLEFILRVIGFLTASVIREYSLRYDPTDTVDCIGCGGHFPGHIYNDAPQGDICPVLLSAEQAYVCSS